MADTGASFRTIAIVGTGSTGRHTLHHLLAGLKALAVMLANIARIEIPPLSQSYPDWLRAQLEASLQLCGVAKDSLHDRSLLPRPLLGSWLRDALERMIAKAPKRSHRVALQEGARVTDIAEAGEDLRVTFDAGDGPEKDAADARYFVSPGVR